MKMLAGLMCAALLTTIALAQPNFDPVRLDPATDERFFYPTLEVTEQNTIRCTWASANVNWIGAYGRSVNLSGNIVSELDTVVIGSTSEISCPPRVEFRALPTGAWAKLVYHE